MASPVRAREEQLILGGAVARLLHVGYVVDDLEAAMRTFALAGQPARRDWSDPAPRPFTLWYRNAMTLRHLRIVHSVALRPPVELIERCDDSPWQHASASVPHHLCYASADAAAICAALDRTAQRLLGRPGDDSGYFRTAGGRILEILPASRATLLYADFSEAPIRSR